MKESLQNIVEWARKNPLLAALILGGVILLGYLVYKRGGGGGGGAADEAPQETPPEAQPSDIPSMGDMGSAGGTSGGGTTTTIPTTPSGEIPQASPLPISPPSVPIFDSSTSSAWTPQSDIASLTAVAPQPVQSAISQAVAAHPRLATARRPQPKESGIAQAVRAHPTLAGAARPGQTAKTPAQLAGASKYFTGTWRGLLYQSGYLWNGLYNGEWYVNGKRAYAATGTSTKMR